MDLGGTTILAKNRVTIKNCQTAELAVYLLQIRYHQVLHTDADT